MENQARISANQTAGIGKLGEFTREQMNAIQYGTQAGALGQIAQGKALMDVHNRGQAFQDSYSKTAYMNAHQSLSQQKGSAQAYDSETNGGNIKIAESMGRVSNASALRGHAASIDVAGSEKNLIGANAASAMEKTRDSVAYHAGKQLDDPDTGAKASIDARGFAIKDSEAFSGSVQRAMSAGAGQNVKDANFEQSTLAAGQETLDETAKQSKQNQANGSNLNSNLLKDPKLKEWSNELKGITSKAIIGREDFQYSEEYKKRMKELQEQIRERSAEVANTLEYGEAEGNRINNISKAVAGGNAIATASAMSVDQHNLGLGGNVGSFTTTSSGGIQGGIQSGVSYSHNESRNYSFGTNISSGSAIAGAALSMGMSASTYGAISSGVAAVGQVAGAAAMFLPGGAMGKGLANMGIIGSESRYAMGIGAARAASSKNAASAVSSANAYMDKLGSFNASGGLGQLRANYELAERGFNNIALSGSPKEVMNARMAMEKARKAYIATEASLNRQYNALSPQARKHVDKELGGNAGGGVTGGVTNFPF